MNKHPKDEEDGKKENKSNSNEADIEKGKDLMKAPDSDRPIRI